MPKLCVLAALLSSLVLAACGDDEKTTTVVEKTTTVTQTETVEATTPAEPKSYAFFQSPSKNIGCAASDNQVRCDIKEHTWKSPVKPADCELDYGGGLVIEAGSTAGFVCAGDTTLNNGPVLNYGEVNKVGLISCKSTEAGMTCVDDETGRGFFLARERYKFS
jgi:hypothetical protein